MKNLFLSYESVGYLFKTAYQSKPLSIHQIVCLILIQCLVQNMTVYSKYDDVLVMIVISIRLKIQYIEYRLNLTVYLHEIQI